MSGTLLSAITFLTETDIAADGNQAIGWLSGIFTLIFTIVVGLLLWSFQRMAKRARQPWPEEQASNETRKPGTAANEAR